MWPHFSNLFWRGVHNVPSLISSNWTAVIFSAAAFIVSQLLLLLFCGGWRSMKKRWGRDFLIGVTSVAIGWTGLFCWSVVVTVYHDHSDLSGQLRALVNEKNKLSNSLREMQSKEGKHKLPAAGIGVAAKAEIKTYISGIPSRYEDAPEGRAFFVTTNYDIAVPYRLTIRCDVPIVKAGSDFWMAEEGNFIKETSTRIDNGIYELSVSAPPLTPNTGIISSLFAKTRISHCSVDVK